MTSENVPETGGGEGEPGARALEGCGKPSGDEPFLAEVRAKVLELLLGCAEQRDTVHPLPSLPWRCGRHLGRTVYAMTGTEASDDDQFIGIMDTAELAAEAIAAHNYRVQMTGSPFRPHMHPPT